MSNTKGGRKYNTRISMYAVTEMDHCQCWSQLFDFTHTHPMTYEVDPMLLIFSITIITMLAYFNNIK